MADDQYNQKVEKLSQAKGEQDKTFIDYAKLAGFKFMQGGELIGSAIGEPNNPINNYLGAGIEGGLLFPKVRKALLAPSTSILYSGGTAVAGIGTGIYDRLYNKNTSSSVDNFDITTGAGIKRSDVAKDTAIILQGLKNYRDAVSGTGVFKTTEGAEIPSSVSSVGETSSKTIAALRSKIFEAMKSPISSSPLLYGKTPQEELADLLTDLEKKTSISAPAPKVEAPKKSIITKAKEAVKKKITAGPKKYGTVPKERLIERGKELEKKLIEPKIKKEIINKPKPKLPPKPKLSFKSYSKALSEIEQAKLKPKGSIKILPSSPEIPSSQFFPELEQNAKNAKTWADLAKQKQEGEIASKLSEVLSKTSKFTFLARGLAEKIPIISAGLDTAEATRYLIQGDIVSSAIKIFEAADQATWFIPGAGVAAGYATIPLNYYLDRMVAKQREKFLKKREEQTKNLASSEFAAKPSPVPTPTPKLKSKSRYDNIVFPEGNTSEPPTDKGLLDNKVVTFTLKPITPTPTPTPKPTPLEIPPISIPSINVPPEEIPVPSVITQTNALETQKITPKTETTAMTPSSTTVNGGSTTNATIINNNNMSKSIPQIREDHRRHTNTLGAYGIY